MINGQINPEYIAMFRTMLSNLTLAQDKMMDLSLRGEASPEQINCAKAGVDLYTNMIADFITKVKAWESISDSATIDPETGFVTLVGE